MKKILSIALLSCMSLPCFAEFEETLPVWSDGKAPETFEQMWSGFDPHREPLEVELLEEWEEDGVILKVVRYRIGVFKGKKAMMAAIYGYPKGGKDLPWLVQMHGGGQSADPRAVVTNAKRGYATISIAWAGRLDTPMYKVDNEHREAFWQDERTSPQYRVTTDWGGVDAYHALCRYEGSDFIRNRPPSAQYTLDSVDSPRNSGWFLCTLAARRALTFLEQQPEVDGERLGAYGHSMGGKLTVMLAGADNRLKAAAPSCGGVTDRNPKRTHPLNHDDVSLERIDCPIFFLSPANDFHGRIDDLQTALAEINSPDWRITCAPHHDHQDTKDYEVATQIWFDQVLRGSFQTLETPRTELNLQGSDGIPELRVFPDTTARFWMLKYF